MSDSGTLHTQLKNQVATVTFGHPLSNSFPSSLLDKLTQELDLLSNNKQISVIVLKSKGEKAFCAGASFNELLEVDNLEKGTSFFSGFANVINAMRKCSKLIIGRIHGKAVGGGVGLASACDYTFATTNSLIKLSEMAIGIGPFVIEPAVSRKIGKTATAQLTFEPTEWKSAEWALEKGLYSRVFNSIPELDNELDKFCAQLSSYNPEALIEIKRVFWEGTDNWDVLLAERAAISGNLVLSEFTKTALNQFKK